MTTDLQFSVVQARKVPLKQLCQRLLDMGEQKVRAILEKANYTNLDAMTHEEQCERGVASVPALLLPNPTQSLSSLGLAKYEVVASEPLHDLKGHSQSDPYILPQGEILNKCTHLIDCCLSKVKKSGADLRRVAIQLFLLLKDPDLQCHPKVLLLLQTILKVGEIFYSLDTCRSPRQLLQLSNTCWSSALIFSATLESLSAHECLATTSMQSRPTPQRSMSSPVFVASILKAKRG